jgi:hypothetical protein
MSGVSHFMPNKIVGLKESHYPYKLILSLSIIYYNIDTLHLFHGQLITPPPGKLYHTPGVY